MKLPLAGSGAGADVGNPQSSRSNSGKSAGLPPPLGKASPVETVLRKRVWKFTGSPLKVSGACAATNASASWVYVGLSARGAPAARLASAPGKVEPLILV